MNNNKDGKGGFTKGQSGNPNGRPLLPEELKKAYKLTQKDVMEKLTKYLHKDMDEIEKIATSKSSLAMDAIVCKVIHEANKRGDEKRLDFLLNRIIGKVDNTVNLNGNLNTTQEIDYSKFSDKELETFRKLVNKAKG